MNRHLILHTPHGPLHGRVEIPAVPPQGLVLLARARQIPLDMAIAAHLAARGHAILAMDLLTAQEAQFADATQNVPRLSQRLLDLLELIRREPDLQPLPLAILASGDTTPAALRVAAQRDAKVQVLACHGGILDRAGVQALELLRAPLLMLFDHDDAVGRQSYARATPHLHAPHEMHLLSPGEDPLLRVASWFGIHLGAT